MSERSWTAVVDKSCPSIEKKHRGCDDVVAVVTMVVVTMIMMMVMMMLMMLVMTMVMMPMMMVMRMTSTTPLMATMQLQCNN